MKQTILTTLLLGCLAVGNFSFGQGVVKGKIKDEKNNALAYANISVFAADSLVTGTISDEKGKFTLQIDKGTYTFSVSFIGYKTRKETVAVTHLPFNLSSIALLPDTALLDEVVITQSAIKSGFNKTTVTVTPEMVEKAVTSEDLFKELPFVRVDKQTHNLQVEREPALLLINGQRIVTENPLLQLPSADKIKRIEVINSPSVKYANDNVSKVVNVILKQNNEGYEGTVKLEVPIPIENNFSSFSYARFGAWLGKFHLFANYRYIGIYKDITENTTRRITDENYLYSYRSNPDNRYEYNKHSILTGVDYFIDERNLINITGRYQGTDLNLTKNKELLESTAGVIAADYDIASDLYYPKFNEYNISTYYKHIFGRNNQELALDVNYFNFENISQTDYTDTDNSTNTTTKRMEQTTDKKESEKVSLSYTLPIAEGNSFEAGTYYYAQNLENSYTSNSNDANSLNYKENRWATYVSWSKEFERFAFRIGANFEQATIKVNKSISNTYTSFFPKIDLSYQLQAHHRIGLSLERKIERPDRAALNPFVYTVNESTISTGNPYLSPSYADGLTFRYQYGSDMATVLFAATYGTSNDAIAPIFYTNAQKQTVSSYANIVDSKFWVFSLEPEFYFFDGDLTIAPYLDLEHLSYSGQTSEITYENSGWHANYGGWLEWYFGDFMFGYDCTFTNYNIKPQGKSRWGSTSYIELERVFFKNKLRVSLGYAWKMQENKYVYNYDNVYEEISVRNPSTLSLTLTYGFSKNKGKRGHRAKMETENGQKYLKK